MGARGPVPKDPKLRKRRNAPTEEVRRLSTVAEAKKRKVPPMPKRPGARPWSVEVKEWWEAMWRSPMAAMWLESDVKSIMGHLCLLHQFANEAKTANALLPVLNAITKQEARLGVSPQDRLRLRWEVPAEPAPTGFGEGEERVVEPEDPAYDPRQALTVHNGGQERKPA